VPISACTFYKGFKNNKTKIHHMPTKRSHTSPPEKNASRLKLEEDWRCYESLETSPSEGMLTENFPHSETLFSAKEDTAPTPQFALKDIWLPKQSELNMRYFLSTPERPRSALTVGGETHTIEPDLLGEGASNIARPVAEKPWVVVTPIERNIRISPQTEAGLAWRVQTLKKSCEIFFNFYQERKPTSAFYFFQSTDNQYATYRIVLENAGRPLYSVIPEMQSLEQILLLRKVVQEILRFHNTCQRIHGDLKGDNILVKDGNLTLIDFEYSIPFGAKPMPLTADSKVSSHLPPELFVATYTDISFALANFSNEEVKKLKTLPKAQWLQQRNYTEHLYAKLQLVSDEESLYKQIPFQTEEINFLKALLDSNHYHELSAKLNTNKATSKTIKDIPAADPRMDVYSVGQLLYSLVDQKEENILLSFPSDIAVWAAMAIQQDLHKRPSLEELIAIFDKILAKHQLLAQALKQYVMPVDSSVTIDTEQKLHCFLFNAFLDTLNLMLEDSIVHPRLTLLGLDFLYQEYKALLPLNTTLTDLGSFLFLSGETNNEAIQPLIEARLIEVFLDPTLHPPSGPRL
jgi:serine/threonine protein kinase